MELIKIVHLYLKRHEDTLLKQYFDDEAQVEVNQEVDKEVTKVVE